MLRKSVLITGASGDIGYAIGQKFAQNGYNVIGTYNKGNVDKLKEYCKIQNVDFLPLKLELCDIDNIHNCFNEAIKNSDYLDTIVCNAGISEEECLLTDMNIDQIQKLIDVNLKGTILCNQEASKHFIKLKHGSIINISSIYGVYGGACETVYSATKSGIIGLTKALALECAPYGIRVNGVAPGFIETNMTSHFNKIEKENIIQNTPLKRLGQPEDVANAVYFLASDNSSFITGEIINVNGGAIRF